MRKTITVPAAGEKLTVDITGCSLIVESCNAYQNVDNVPTFNFSPGKNNFPFYTRSVYFNDGEEFQALEVFGTAESAGDSITLLSVDDCLKTFINVNVGETYQAQAGTTQQQQIADNVFSFVPGAIQNADGKMPSSVTIVAVDNEVRYASNIDPVQGAQPQLGMPLTVGTWYKLEGLDFILKARFINATNAQNSTLVYTFRY